MSDLAIDIRNVVKRYDQHVAVSDLSLAVPRGSVYGLLGPNGAGKTTTIRMILNIIVPDSGTITLLGQPHRANGITDRIGYLPEERGLYKKMQVRRVLRFLAELKGVKRREADRRKSSDPNDPNHTFFFSIMDGKKVIDANVGGNAARWINHSCAPNCESDEDDDTHRVYIKAVRNIKAGEELNYDYGLVIDEPYTKKLKMQYQCLCGAKNCRGTMLAKKR